MSVVRPNLLLIVMDCARADKWLGPSRTSITPNMDRYAAEGAVFSTTIAETSCTTPCFAGLLTGAYSFHHGISGVGGYCLAEDTPTLPEVMKSAGYSTYMEATGPLLPLAGLTRGFDEYNYRVAVEYLDGHWGRRLRDRLRGGGFHAPWFLLLHLWELHLPRQIQRPMRSRRFGNTPYERAVSSLDSQLPAIVDAAGSNTITVITGDHGEKTAAEAFEPGTAVFEAARLYGADRAPRLARMGPHWLIGPMATQQLRARYQARLERFSQRKTPRPVAHGYLQRWRDTRTLLKLAPHLKLSEYWKLRNAAGRAELAATTDALDTDAVRQRIERLVLAIGDDGLFDVYLRLWAGMLSLHMLAGHIVHVYDYLVRVPFVLRGPGIRAGLRIDRMVRQVDIAATLLELVEIARPAGFSPSGRSVASALGGTLDASPPAYLSVTGQPLDLTLRGVRTDDFKLTYGSADAAVPVELYDLRTDPAEKRNIAAASPTRVVELRTLAESMIPAGGPRIRRVSTGSRDEVELTKRLSDLGYI